MILLAMLIIGLNGCSRDEKETAYEKRNETLSVEAAPASYRKYALVSGGTISVQKGLTTDGPLADVHANGDVKARALSLDISGMVSASNDLEASLVRSFDYTSPLHKAYVEVRALKVDEYLNTNLLDDYYLLTADGRALHKVKDQNDTAIVEEGVAFTYENSSWKIVGDEITLSHSVKVETDLVLESDYLFVMGTLMVQGDLTASGELNINVGTPFEKALIVDRDINIDKLVAIGRVHGSGSFTSYGEVNIMGNVEIDSDVTLYGDAKINFLDNIYKAALYEAQEEAGETNTTMSLAHSQLFSDVKGKNSVVLFTFVEGDYILNENVINYLIENNQTSEFTYRSYLYGATIDYAAQLQKFDGLSPYFQNKQALFKKLRDEGYENIKIKESLDIAPSNLYHTFADADGDTIGTYLVYSISSVFDINSTQLLTQEQKDEAVYVMEHKDELDAAQEVDAREKEAEQKQGIIDNSEMNLSVKSAMLNEIEEVENNESSIDKEAVLAEAKEDRVHEWVEYKDLASDIQEVNATEILVEEKAQIRGWKKRWKKKFKKFFKKVTFTECKKHTNNGTIFRVNTSTDFWSYRSDAWSTQVSIHNDIGYCTPTAIAMIMNYNYHVRKGKVALYGSYTLSSNNPESERMAKEFHTDKEDGTSGQRYISEIPFDTSKEIKRLGMSGYAYTWYTAVWNRDKHFANTQWYIKQNNPIMFNAMKGTNISGYGEVNEGHSMPVIGYKYEYYKGSCWKNIVPAKKWILVDTEFRRRGYKQNQRGHIRFDSRSKYFRAGAMTYVRVY